MLVEREVALRLALDRNVARKLSSATRSRFFWLYSLSLWDPEAFWKCVSGGLVFAVVAVAFMGVSFTRFVPSLVNATAVFEYFILGLILTWLLYLGPWLNPINLKVIFTFIFRLYRQNRTVDDLSAEDIGRLFPPGGMTLGLTLKQGAWSSRMYAHIERSSFLGPLLALSSRIVARIERSSFLGPLLAGVVFASLLIGLLVMAS